MVLTCTSTGAGIWKAASKAPFQLSQIVAVEDADVGDPHVLEEADLGPRALEALLCPRQQVERRLADNRHTRQRSHGGRLRLLVGAGEAHLVQARREPADRRADAHLVVVEHDQQRVLHIPEMVERLHRQPRADRRVPDADRDPLPPRRIGLGLQVTCGCQPHADRHSGPGVAAVEDVVLALAPAREPADAVDLAQRLESVPAPGQQLVGVGLVPGVPHDPIARRVHDPVQRERDLDRTERAREVSAGALDGADHLLAQLAGESLQLLRAEVAELPRFVNRLEQRQGWFALLKSPASI